MQLWWRSRLFFGLILLLPMGLLAQEGPDNHPELDWYSLETEHFFVHFHAGEERTARVVAKVAEDVYGPVTALYLFEPDGKVHFIIRDHDDYSNGASFYYDNKIEIWASAMDFELRGTHNWLRNVVTHEFTHMIQLQAARKMSRKVPALYLQWLGYEKEKRPDVLYGYPNTIVSYPIAFTLMPSWFAEGVAQFQLPGLEYDNWDAHRDMMLRTAVLENKMLSFDQMSSFGKNSIGNERAYNQGYALVAYMVQRFGLESLRKATSAMRAPFRISFSSAIHKATGFSGYELYDEWKKELIQKYAFQTREINKNVVAGKMVEKVGTGNFYPLWSQDGKSVAYLSNASADFLSQTALVIRDLQHDKVQGIKGGVRLAFDWSANGKFFVYSKRTDENRYGSRYFDLYLYDIYKKKEIRLTRFARAHSPALSPDNKKVAFVVNADGTQNLAILDLTSRKIVRLTDYKNGEQVYTPHWAPAGDQIVFAFSQSEGRQIRLYTLATEKITTVVAEGRDSRDAVFSPDGQWVYFSSDRTGIFNIFRKNLKTNKIEQLTNVLGGAFMPAVSREGNLAFATFIAEGYKLAVRENPQPVASENTSYLTYTSKVRYASTANGVADMDLSKIRTPEYDDTQLPDIKARPYRNIYGAVSFLPRVVRDYGTTKIGSYLYSNDVLNNYGLLGGFAVNKDRDYDLFGQFEYNQLGPTLFLEAYNQVRHATFGIDKYKYNLAEVDLGVQMTLPYHHAHRLRTAVVYNRYGARIHTKIGTQLASFNYNYFIGRTLQMRYTYEGVGTAVDRDANPRAGRRVMFEYDRNWNNFINGFAINSQYGTLQEVYKKYNYNQIQLDWHEYFSLPHRHSAMLRLRGGLIDKPVDSFFYLYAGGIDGIRGYPFYAIEGRKLLQGTIAYRFPVFWNIDYSFLHLYFDKLFFGVFGDYGNAFSEDKIEFANFKRAVGAQLRLELFSFYSYPTRLFFDAAYGFDRFQNRGISYGNEWRYYFGVTFGFFD